MIRIILVLAVQSCLGYRSCPAEGVARESLSVSQKSEFYVFYDLYDLVTLTASSSAISHSSSMVETAASSASDKIVSTGGFQISVEDLKTAAKALNVSAEGLNVSSKAFSHSELVFCKSSQFTPDDREKLSLKIGAIIPESFNEDASRKKIGCFRMWFGFSECTQKACAIGEQWVPFGTANDRFGRRYRIPLGLNSLECGPNPFDPVGTLKLYIEKEKKDQWKGTNYKLATHNCNTFARYVVLCVLKMSMPNTTTLGANHAVSSASGTKWALSVGATVLGGLLTGPLGLVAGPLLFAAAPGKFCDK